MQQNKTIDKITVCIVSKDVWQYLTRMLNCNIHNFWRKLHLQTDHAQSNLSVLPKQSHCNLLIIILIPCLLVRVLSMYAKIRFKDASVAGWELLSEEHFSVIYQ